MKRLTVIVLIFGLLFTGCATLQNWICANRVTIENYVATAQATVDSIDAAFPGMIPPEYEVAKAAAYTVIAIGKNILDNKVCPTPEDVASVQTKQAVMGATMKSAAKIQAAKMMRK